MKMPFQMHILENEILTFAVDLKLHIIKAEHNGSLKCRSSS